MSKKLTAIPRQSPSAHAHRDMDCAVSFRALVPRLSPRRLPSSDRPAAQSDEDIQKLEDAARDRKKFQGEADKARDEYMVAIEQWRKTKKTEKTQPKKVTKKTTKKASSGGGLRV